MEPIRESSLFRSMRSLFGQKDSLFPAEQGIYCKVLNPLGNRLPKPPQEARIRRNFQNSQLSSLFSVRHRALPDLQGMKVGNSALSSGMWQPTFLLANGMGCRSAHGH